MTILNLPKQSEIHVLNLENELAESQVLEIASLHSVSVKRFDHYESKGNAAFHNPNEYADELSVPPQMSCIIKYSVTPLGKYENAVLLEGFSNGHLLSQEFGSGNYPSFVATDDAMNDGTWKGSPVKAVLITKEIEREKWDRLNQSDYGCVIAYKGVYFFRDVNISIESVTCRSRNNFFENFKLDLADVSQIFKVLKRQY